MGVFILSACLSAVCQGGQEGGQADPAHTISETYHAGHCTHAWGVAKVAPEVITATAVPPSAASVRGSFGILHVMLHACMRKALDMRKASSDCRKLIHEDLSMVSNDLWACTGVGCQRHCRPVTGGLPCAIATNCRRLRSLRCPSSCPACPGSRFRPPPQS